MGKQRPLLLGSVGGQQYYERIAGQRKKYCIWVLAVVAPFLLLFCFFPLDSSFRPSSYRQHVVASQQSEPTSEHAHHHRSPKLGFELDSQLVGRRIQNEDRKSSKSIIELITARNAIKDKQSRKPIHGRSRKPNIDDGEEDLSSLRSIAKELRADQNPITRSKQSNKPTGAVVKSEESMDDLDEEFSSFGKRLDEDRSRSLKHSEQMDDLEEEFPSIGKRRDGDRYFSSASSKQKQEKGEREDELNKFDKEESQSKKRRQARNDGGKEVPEADEDPMIISEWSSKSRSASTQKKARKSSSSQQQDEDDLSDLTLQSTVISKAEPFTIRKKAPAKCNLSKGKWIRDKEGPLYTNATCPWISHDQINCQLINKSSKEPANWRWKPDGCNLERFQAKAFLKLMQRKSLAFVGDKLAKAQMQSLLCLLAQVERPNLIYDDKANQSASWHFSSWNFTLSMVWSPYLVQETAEEGYKKLRLDKLDTKWAELVPRLDVLVMGVGSLFTEPAAYLVKGEVVGCHACKTINAIDSKTTTTEMSLYSAYRAAMRSSIMGVAALPGFEGITVFMQAYGFEGRRYQNVSMKMKEIQEEELEKAWKRGIPNESKVEVLETALQINATDPRDDDQAAASSSYNSIGCLPAGLSDTWNQFLQHILNRSSSSSS